MHYFLPNDYIFCLIRVIVTIESYKILIQPWFLLGSYLLVYHTANYMKILAYTSNGGHGFMLMGPHYDINFNLFQTILGRMSCLCLGLLSLSLMKFLAYTSNGGHESMLARPHSDVNCNLFQTILGRTSCLCLGLSLSPPQIC